MDIDQRITLLDAKIDKRFDKIDKAIEKLVDATHRQDIRLELTEKEANWSASVIKKIMAFGGTILGSSILWYITK